MTARNRMRGKLRQIKEQLRERMYDPVPQTANWLKSVVPGCFNYHAAPGNIGSLSTFSAFRDRVLGPWWRGYSGEKTRWGFQGSNAHAAR